MNLPAVAAHRALEMMRVGRQNRHIVEIDRILSRDPRYNPVRSLFRIEYGRLRAQMHNVSGPDPEFIPAEFFPIYCRE